ncbi:MAG: helix-turn-helix transcriptional regulator [Burkholderiales bacterium]|nr:helix-turn-helix transcriptional regulator [Burkholderiales bacterium]MDE2395876.1 helix-turn-helix transcriptional regulator [Burkholderiales bacterium]MDE2454236.1 helix-turn-helix transcriptional regulator [Burkholderiales bacterium]
MRQSRLGNLDVKRAPRNQLPQALRLARTARGLSQESFAEVSGRTYLSQLERGERRPTLTKLDDLAGVLEIHPASLAALSYLPKSATAADVERLLRHIRSDLTDLLAASA